MLVADSAVNITVQKIMHLSQPYYTDTLTSVRISHRPVVGFAVNFSFSYMFREFIESKTFFYLILYIMKIFAHEQLISLFKYLLIMAYVLQFLLQGIVLRHTSLN